MAAIRPSLETVKDCMSQPHLIRNVCILAHVDHGKTTIADSLLSTNHLVSKRMAGFLRYLDDRLDEQERGITMKCSAVSLVNTLDNENILVNIIDTPGHIDFSSEVGAALRVSDGALIVVDLVEGVCVQTREAIKQSFAERCKMLLVLNKFDKLIVELRKDINDIFQHILRAIEDCNALIAELYQYEYPDSNIDIENTGLLFAPEAGNIIFSSAIDGWGFTTRQISRMLLGVVKNETEESLDKKLWDFDAYVDSTGNIKYGAIEKNKTNLFIQLCLKTIIYIYTTISIQMQKDKIDSIIKKLNITKITRDMNHNDNKIQLRAIMQAWSPLSETILLQIKKLIPPPSHLDGTKIDYLLDRKYSDDLKIEQIDNLAGILKNCSDNEPTIAYISKMFCVDNKNLSQNKPKIFQPKPRNEIRDLDVKKVVEDEIREEQNFSLIALARVFHGSLKVGQELYIINQNTTNGPNAENGHIARSEANGQTQNAENAQKTTNEQNAMNRQTQISENIQNAQTEKNAQNGQFEKIVIKDLYILFGRELVQVEKVSAGNICGIGGLENSIMRSATISTTQNCVPFIEHPTIEPIVRNVIEPQNLKDLPVLRNSLRLLMQSDPCVQVITQETGELILLTAGDVHLAKCLEDLKNIFAKIEINVSDPIVPLRETIFEPPKYDYRKDLENTISLKTNEIHLEIIAISIPQNIVEHFEKNLKQLRAKKYVRNYDIFDANAIWSQFKTKVWTISTKIPHGLNLLINETDFKHSEITASDLRTDFVNLVINAFYHCCKNGPICEEPLKNCAFVIRKFEIFDVGNTNIKFNANIELAICAAFREAFNKKAQRLMEPIFTTTIQVTTNILGKVYSVVNRRFGKVLDAVGMDEQEKTFLVKAQIPVVESTGFANEIRKTTSGQAIPNLKFSHFEIIDGDPFYEPQEDGDEDEDVNIEASLRAAKLRKDVRRRKGLHVEEQVVVHAEKQRTLNKKK